MQNAISQIILDQKYIVFMYISTYPIQLFRLTLEMVFHTTARAAGSLYPNNKRQFVIV